MANKNKYDITGMSCAACVARVEKAVNAVDGVTECAVNLLTNSMIVSGTASAEKIIKAVTDAGYGAQPVKATNSSKKNTHNSDPLQDKESPALLKRLFWSLGFLLILMYFSMGHMMWNFPLPPFFENNHVAIGLV
ncbi:MAG: cation transporter, partial [Treponema sp.]|nr:cation transporter [Treponema sp.]